MLDYERKAQRKGYRLIIGIDESGRGPLAGPVVACAVALKSFEFECRIDDSKKISANQREKAFFEIHEKSYVGLGIINEKVIDDLNILQATFFAMTVAVRDLLQRLPADFFSDEVVRKQQTLLLVDGHMFKSELPFAYQPIVAGDQKSLSIACASIIAKVTRDRILSAYDQVFPQYGFRQHKGYPTADHKSAILKHGLSLIHRRSFNHL